MGESRSELLLGVDLGTSGASGVLARPDGEVVAVAERPHEVSRPKPGWVEHDAEEDWWGGFAGVCSEQAFVEGLFERARAVGGGL